MSEEQRGFTEEERQQVSDWLQKELRSHIAHLLKTGVVTSGAKAKMAWMVPNMICLSEVDGKGDGVHWVISGAGQVDSIPRSTERTPREVVRHFALRWQLHAARLDGERAEGADFSPAAYAMQRNAEFLYKLAGEDQHWSS